MGQMCIRDSQAPRAIEGFADVTSAVAGDDVTLFVNTVAHIFHVEAYRMGYYQGLGARLVWTSDEVRGIEQPPPTVTPGLNTVQCSWAPSLSVPIDESWPPGAYLLKLVGDFGEQQYIPLCVRDDASTAAFVVQHAVTTWQAYNLWGGYSLYNGLTAGGVSFGQSVAGKDFDQMCIRDRPPRRDRLLPGFPRRFSEPPVACWRADVPLSGRAERERGPRPG